MKNKQIIPLVVMLLVLIASYALSAGALGRGNNLQTTSNGITPPRVLAESAEEYDIDLCAREEISCLEIGKSATVKHGGENPSFQAGLPVSGEVKSQILQIAQAHNFQWPDYLVKLAYCESRFNPKARNDNGKYGMDRGLYQINNKYHPTVSDVQADDIVFATKWTMDKINQGKQHLWSCDKLIKNN